MTPTETQTEPAVVTSRREDHLQRIEIDRSVRWPVTFFIVNGVLWLVFAAMLGLLASLKEHSPTFLDYDWLTWLHFGRLEPAAMTALIYGWGFQAGIGVSLWLMARLCRVPLRNGMTLLVAGKFWNVGVVIGVFGILAGYGTSAEWMPFPALVWPLLLLSFTAIAVWMVIIFRVRRPGEPYISEWYLLGACFWFPWVFLTANLFIHVFPDSGVMGPAVSAWFKSNLLLLYFVPVGLASAYYFIPKVVARPIFSYQLAITGFWGLAAFAGWTGIQKYMGGPLPAWMPAVGSAATILMLIPVLVVALNHFYTTRGRHHLVQYSPALRFTVFGAMAYTGMSLLAVVLALFPLSGYTQFTYAESGFALLALYGFFSMTMFGAIYYIIPRITGCEWLSRRLINFHFWCSSYGILAMAGSLVVGGIAQGTSMNNPANWDGTFVGVVMTSRGYLIGRSLAWCFLILANVVFFCHVILMVLRLGRRSTEPTMFGEVPADKGEPEVMMEPGTAEAAKA